MVVIGFTLYGSVRLVLSCYFLVHATDPNVSKRLWILPGLSPSRVYLVLLMGSRDGNSPSSCRFPSCLFSLSFEPQSLCKICTLYYQILWPAFFPDDLDSASSQVPVSRGPETSLVRPVFSRISYTSVTCSVSVNCTSWSGQKPSHPSPPLLKSSVVNPTLNSCNHSGNINFTSRSLWLSKPIATILESGQVIEYSKYNCKETHRGENKTPPLVKRKVSGALCKSWEDSGYLHINVYVIYYTYLLIVSYFSDFLHILKENLDSVTHCQVSKYQL